MSSWQYSILSFGNSLIFFSFAGLFLMHVFQNFKGWEEKQSKKFVSSINRCSAFFFFNEHILNKMT